MSNFKAKALEQNYPLCKVCQEPLPKKDWKFYKKWGCRCFQCWQDREMDLALNKAIQQDQIDRRYR